MQDREAMGEQPIFSCLAHVFHIDPKTKRTWITASTKAVSVSFFYDSSRNLYRIISVEGTKAVINSTITPSMSFTQTSQKFGQWSDVRANTVYGLGFSSESELTKFVEKFQEVKEATKGTLPKSGGGGGPNGSSAVTPSTSANTSPVTGRNSAFQSNDSLGDTSGLMEPPQMMSNASIMLQQQQQHQQNTSSLDSPSHKLIGDGKPNASLNNSSTESGPVHSGSGGDQQLKYENERLKMALAQSCANAKKWEIELATLKSNNIRLTSALQESTSNVDEWKRQLQTYKDENLRLKREMDALKAARGPDVGDDELRRENGMLRNRMQTLENDKLSAELELKTVQLSLKERDSREANFKQLGEMSGQMARHLQDMCHLQKDIDKVLQAST